jgi:hypothetical protein
MIAMTLDRLAELMESRFQQMDARFQQMDARFQQMDARFEQMDARFERMEVRTEAVEHGLIGLRTDMLERFHRVDTRIDRLSDDMRNRFRSIS